MSNLTQKINLINGSVSYISLLSEEVMSVKFAQQEIPKENETYNTKTEEETKAEIPLTSDLSVRNYKNTYIIPIEKERVLLNLIPQKLFVTDSGIINFINTDFEYFTEVYPDGPGEEPFDFIDGIIFRYVGDGPLPIDQYTYYIMDDGIAKQIPNFKTLEVMLFQRGENYNSVRIIEKSQFNDIINNSGTGNIPDKSNDWTAAMEDQVNFGKYLDLLKDAKSAGEIAGSAAAEADKNIKAYKAERDAEKAKAEQAKAEADAAKAQAEAEKAEAQQKQAQADAEKAKAEQAKAEAEAEKAQYESQQNGNGT